MAKKQSTGKLDTSGASSGLYNPFGNLELSGLPPGPDAVPVHPETVITPEPSSRPGRHGRVVLRREKSGRGGKTVVVVGDIPADVNNEKIEEMACDLRKACGCGGTVRDREIEIQGDQPARVCQWLEEAGFRVAGVRA